jgi:Putative restriction endonuclease
MAGGRCLRKLLGYAPPMSSAAAAARHAPQRHVYEAYDPTVYPVEEKVGQDSLQSKILELLRPLVDLWLVLCERPSFVGSDQFVYYKRHNPKKCVAPDVYVLPGVPRDARVKVWQVWKTGIVPSLCIEVVASDDAEKDYREAPERYAELGVDELIIFDADHHLSPERVRWQRYRKLKTRGFVLVESSNGDRIRSRVLRCFLRVVGEGDEARVRLATGPAGDELVPTEAEAERAAKEVERAAKEAERAAKEVERAAKEAERAAKEAALGRVAELEALLAGAAKREPSSCA